MESNGLPVEIPDYVWLGEAKKRNRKKIPESVWRQSTIKYTAYESAKRAIGAAAVADGQQVLYLTEW